MPDRSDATGVELRVRPLSAEEYALWVEARADALDLPARPGTTEVGILVYARTGPVANALVRAEPGVRLTAEIRVLDVSDPASTASVVAAVVESFTRGGYTQFRAWTAESATAPWLSCGFAVVGRDFTTPLTDTRVRRGRVRRTRDWTVEEAGEKDVASVIAWLTSARTRAARPRTPDRATLRALRERPDQHVLVLRDGEGAAAADAWASVVESTGPQGSIVRGAVVDALRLRGGLDARAVDAADEALRSWCREQGLARLDVHLPATADPRLADHLRRRGFDEAGTQLELVRPDQDEPA